MDINPNLLRLSAGIPAAGIGGLLGYLTAPKKHRLENMARGAGVGYMTGTGIGIGSMLGDSAAPDDSTTSQRLPYMASGGLAGGALGLGVGRMLQGVPHWQQQKRFREELLGLLRTRQYKLRHELRHELLNAIGQPAEKRGIGPVLTQLITAKQLSDRRDYKTKHQRLRELMEQHPDDFFVDSMQGSMAGITHRPTGFRIHAPLRVVPVGMKGFSNVEPSVA